MAGYADKQYRFAYSEQIPGHLISVQTRMSDGDDAFLEEEVRYTGVIDAATAGNSKRGCRRASNTQITRGPSLMKQFIITTLCAGLLAASQLHAERRPASHLGATAGALPARPR